MARESFAQPWIAELMNKHFICIKVDREEKPEVDKLMMDAVQMIQGHGGWPLNCFCLPDGRPFFGGTYFPPEDRGQGQVPWPQLLMRVADFYHTSKNELAANADAIAKNLTHLTQAPDADGTLPTHEDLIKAAERLCENHDDAYGGFGAAPKFPSPSTIDFLIAVRATAAAEKNRALATRLDAVITMTLGAMARGGLFDQIGGGFHRYCVDRDWTVPHFEKMLYDNAQLIGTYAEAWARYRDPLYLRVCEETIAWLQREMVTDHGLFASAIDADTEHEEGITYVWQPKEIVEVLGDKAFAFAAAYGITDQGNFEGANILKLRGKFAEREELKPARTLLLARRNLRAQPTRDDKALLSWNALLIKNLAKAGWIFNRKDWWELASATEQTLWKHCVKNPEGTLALKPVGYQNTFSGNGTLTDYAWLAEAEIQLAATAAWGNGQAPYRERVIQLTQGIQQEFRDEHALGYFLVPAHREDLSVRQKDWFDNAVPSGNSSLLHTLTALEVLTSDSLWAHEFTEQSRAYSGLVRNVPSGIAHALQGLTQAAMGVVVLKFPAGHSHAELQSVINGNAQTRPHEKPFRLVFLQAEARTQGFEICVGKICVPALHSANKIRDFI
jgi:uncharacterized protein YyaL (SSP411 family)